MVVDKSAEVAHGGCYVGKIHQRASSPQVRCRRKQKTPGVRKKESPRLSGMPPASGIRGLPLLLLVGRFIAASSGRGRSQRRSRGCCR
jgi:hypothetical protein